MSSSKVGVTYYVRGYNKSGSKSKEVEFTDFQEALDFVHNKWVDPIWNEYDMKLEREVHSHKVLKKRQARL